MGGTPYEAHAGAVGLKPEPKLLLKPDAVGGRPLKTTSTESLPRFLPRYFTLSICKLGLHSGTCGAGRANRRCATAGDICDNAQTINASSHNKFFKNVFIPV